MLGWLLDFAENFSEEALMRKLFLPETARFLICCKLIDTILLLNFTQLFQDLNNSVYYFDKYQHLLAGILLVIGFYDNWKKSWLCVFGALLLFNILWEETEALSCFTPWPILPSVFDRLWLMDTAGDIFTTMSAGMIWFFLFYRSKS